MSGLTRPTRGYIERCPECGGVTGAIVMEDPHCGPDWRKEIARFLSSAARSGYTIENVIVEEARAMKWGHRDGCSTNPARKKIPSPQRDLFSEASA